MIILICQFLFTKSAKYTFNPTDNRLILALVFKTKKLLVDLKTLKEMKQNREQRSLEFEGYTSNYQKTSVYPSTSELVSLASNNKLPVNKITGPYESTNEYLSTHFYLLREDFIKPIRENLISFLQDKNERFPNIKIHQVQPLRMGVKSGDTCICFEIKKSITEYSLNLSNSPKRFMTGSLLIFTSDNFQTTFCGRVAENKNVIYRKVLVSLEKPVRMTYQKTYLMIECSNFFEPYYNVLKVLQTMDPIALSMQQYLVEMKTSICTPKYLNGVKHTVLDQELNKSQLVAINAALSQELIIIQGPPGTGKTFLGLKIAKELLLMSKKWYSNSPMLIISFTNHALDQFLQGLTSSTDKILRYGGQSKNPDMKKYSLRECRNRYYKSNVDGRRSNREIACVFKEYNILEKKIHELGNQLDNIATSRPTCIFYFKILAQAVPEIKNFVLNERHEDAIRWLLEDDGTLIQDDQTHNKDCPIKHMNKIQESQKIAELYNNHFKDFQKKSKYCMISVSMIKEAAEKLQTKITEVIKGIETKKNRCVSTDDITIFRQYLQEKKKQIEELSNLYDFLVDKLIYLKICLKTEFNNNIDQRKVDLSNPFQIPVCVRWQLYKYWLKCYQLYVEKKIDLLIKEYNPTYEQFNEVQEKNNLKIMKSQIIIGITTTSAARLHSTIKALQCPIVIVEEAAEVLEAHIIPVLTEHCQHLILIGDHQQLKPTTADYDIETRHKLGISLFERMVTNNIQCHTLNVQHRMRPEISSLITPSIYPILYNHASVKSFSQIKGVNQCLFFITHDQPEQGSGDSSKKNIHEAKYFIDLTLYLLKNGYKPEDITILTAYLGQVGLLIQKQKECCDDQIKSVKITSVDNFQGEENKIILLSLVRNNPMKNIGFLSIENRVCVALSRAKEGMYIMGNMEHLTSKSLLWQKIRLSLEEQNALGKSLPLKCQQHGTITRVEFAEDFNEYAPNGGCKKICQQKLLCGHICQKQCHNDDLDHTRYKCQQSCLRFACNDSSHKCKKQCYQDCGMCMHNLPPKLDCGHNIKCFMEEIEDYRCEERVYLRLYCGHKVSVSCNEVDDKLKDDLQCSACKEKEAKKIDKDFEEMIMYTQKLNITEKLGKEDKTESTVVYPKKMQNKISL